MASVAVRKSPPVIVRPPETATTSGTAIKLTSFDKVFVKFPFTVLLVLEHLSQGGAAVQTIKRALSDSLVHYHPFCGRITAGADDESLHINCTGEGAEFVAASAGCTLKEAGILDEAPAGIRTLLDELAVYYPVGSYGGSGDPLLSVQVTEFACGGVVLGTTWNHAVADGVGIAQFLGAVGELARGSSSPSVAPVRWDGSVSALPPLFDPVQQVMLMHPAAASPDMDLLVPLEVTVPWSCIDRIKAESSRDGRRRPCTSFEAVLAVLWRCRTLATMSSGSGTTTPACLTFAANMRKHVGAQDGYYGNCIANQLVAAAAAAGAVADAPILDLVEMIRRAKDRVPDTLTGRDAESSLLQLRELGGRYGVLHASSWRNIGFERVDLGGGPPASVLFHGRDADGTPPPVPYCVMFPPCRGKDGVSVLSVLVKEEHADAFLGELARHA